jgi:hypothetical protein
VRPDDSPPIFCAGASSRNALAKVPFTFTGKIGTVRIELKEMRTADRHEADHARKVAILKKALAD